MKRKDQNSLEFFDEIKKEWCISEEQWKPFWNDVLTFARKYHKERIEYSKNEEYGLFGNEHIRQLLKEFAEKFRQWQRQWDLFDRQAIIKKPKNIDEFIDEFCAKKRT